MGGDLSLFYSALMKSALFYEPNKIFGWSYLSALKAGWLSLLLFIIALSGWLISTFFYFFYYFANCFIYIFGYSGLTCWRAVGTPSSRTFLGFYAWGWGNLFYIFVTGGLLSIIFTSGLGGGCGVNLI